MNKVTKFHQKFNVRYVPAKAHYFLFCGGISGVVPYLPMFAKNLGISAELVGVIYATLPCVQLVTKPVFSGFADKTGAHQNMLTALITIMVLSLFPVSFLPEIPENRSPEISFASNVTCHPSELTFSNCDREMHSNSSTLTCASKCLVPCESNDSLDCSQNNTFTRFLNENSSQSFLSFSSILKLSEQSIDHCSHFRMDQSNNSWPIPFCKADMTLFCHFQCHLNDWSEGKTRTAIYFQYQFWWFFLAMIIGWIAFGLIVVIGDTVVYNLLEEEKHLFGLQRLWGTVGWGLFILLTGYFDSIASSKAGKLDYSPGFYVFAILLLIDLYNIRQMKFNFRKTPSGPIASRLGALMTKPRIVVFTMVVFLIGVLTGFMESFLFWYLTDLGSGSVLLGLSRSVQCFLGELPAFVVSGWVLRRIGHVNAMSVVLAVFGLRFVSYSLLVDPWWTLPIELCHSVTFGLFYATLTGYASIVAPPGMTTTLQGIMGASYEGAGFAVGSFCGGFIYGQFGGRRSFFSFGLLALVLCVVNVITQILITRSEKLTQLPTKAATELSDMMSTHDEEQT